MARLGTPKISTHVSPSATRGPSSSSSLLTPCLWGGGGRSHVSAQQGDSQMGGRPQTAKWVKPRDLNPEMMVPMKIWRGGGALQARPPNSSSPHRVSPN